MTAEPTPHLRIGTAGWSIPAEVRPHFPAMGSLLESYSRVFDVVEINSSFYRPHRISTYQRWAAAVPDTFRFAVKVPKAITHDQRLIAVEARTDTFLAEVAGLGNRLGPLLVQLPPSLAFHPATAERFLRHLRAQVDGPIACEPRHPSWFAAEATALLTECHIARVAADPAPVPLADQPGGWPGLTYYRLHGTPQIYYSNYSDQAIQSALTALSPRVAKDSTAWIIFDNTAAGAATPNALTAQKLGLRATAP